jgi:hypothetical protein
VDVKMQLLVWTILSLLLRTVAVNILYRAQGGRILLSFDESLSGVLARETALFIAMIGIPFVALVTGASGLDLMALGADLSDPANIIGFTLIDWVRGVGEAGAVVIGLLVVLWLGGRSVSPGSAWGIGPIAFRDAIYNEVHWTFYRAAPFLLIGDPFWGVIVGDALVLLEWITHPASRGILATIEGRQYMTLQLACLLCSGFLYLATRNLWLMIIADLILQSIGSRLISATQAGSQAIKPGE